MATRPRVSARGLFVFPGPIPKEDRTVQAVAVLTVEDDPVRRADLRLVLEDAGFDVAAQASGVVEALELARELEPDVIVFDPARGDRAEATQLIVAERRVPIVELERPFSSTQVVETLGRALVEHREREIRDTRSSSLHSIESLVDELSFATPEPSELEQKAWDRGHVWRRVDAAPQRDEE
jgi:chemotaxis response regulator CheB